MLPKSSAKLIDGTEKPKIQLQLQLYLNLEIQQKIHWDFLRTFQNAKGDTANLAVNEHVRTYLCEVCLLTSNDCRNDEHSDVTEGKTCEGVCII